MGDTLAPPGLVVPKAANIGRMHGHTKKPAQATTRREWEALLNSSIGIPPLDRSVPDVLAQLHHVQDTNGHGKALQRPLKGVELPQ